MQWKQMPWTAEAHAGGHLGDKKKVFGDDSEAVIKRVAHRQMAAVFPTAAADTTWRSFRRLTGKFAGTLISNRSEWPSG
jgi:hypothetical protein